MIFINRPAAIKKNRELMQIIPITALFDARQTEKTTLTKKLKGNHYFDLENLRDLRK